MRQDTTVVIIGGGLSGLSLAVALEKQKIPFILIEKDDVLGGVIQTRYQEGFTFEMGPNTGILSTPEVVELFRELSDDVTLEKANPSAKNRWIWKGNKFHTLPSGLFSGICTPLFSCKDKLALPLEFLKKKGDNPNETVGALAERRLGKSFVEYAVDPFIGGIYAGDPYSLITKYALPKLYALEQTYGGFFKGAFHKKKERKSNKEALVTKEIFSAKKGLGSLIKAMAHRAGKGGELLTGITSLRLEKEENGQWSVKATSKNGAAFSITTTYVVTTIRGDLLAGLFHDPDIAHSLESLNTFPYAPISEVVVGYRSLPNIKCDAFGGVIPSCEKRKVLGILFPSSCFSHRTPVEAKDARLFSVFVGGVRNKELFQTKSEKEIEQFALEELQEMLGIPKDVLPDLLVSVHYSHAIPQYDLSYPKHLQTITRFMEKEPHIIIGGGIKDGIGIPNRITQGVEIAQKIANELHHKIK